MFGQLQGFRKEVVLQVEANMAICKAPVLASQVSMEAQSEKGSVPFKLDFFSEGPDQRVWGEFRQNSHTSQEKGSNNRTIINKVFTRLRHSNPVVEISTMVLLLDKKILTDPLGNCNPTISQGHLQLVAWPVSGIHSRMEVIQRGLLSSSVPHAEAIQRPQTYSSGWRVWVDRCSKVQILLMYL